MNEDDSSSGPFFPHITQSQAESIRIAKKRLSELKSYPQMFSELHKAAQDAAERFNRFWAANGAGIVAVVKDVGIKINQLKPYFSDLLIVAKRFVDQDKLVMALDTAGYLPHESMPWHSFTSDSTPDDIKYAVREHYTANWSTIGADLIKSIDDCNIDDEAKLSFIESVASHGAGHYRSVVRNLMCEVERLIRFDLKGRELGSRHSKEFLTDIAELPFDYFSEYKIGWWLYNRIADHIYRNITDQSDIDFFEKSNIPNRHGAIHGIVTYNKFENSLNSIILAHYLFSQVDLFKRLLSNQSEMERDLDKIFESYKR